MKFSQWFWAFCLKAYYYPEKLISIFFRYCSLAKLLRVASLFKEGFECFRMFWLGMSYEDILADVNERKHVPDRYLKVVL